MNEMVLGDSPVRHLLELELQWIGESILRVIWYEEGLTGLYSFILYVSVNL